VTEESCGWLFVDTVPLLHDKRRVKRQMKIETWLDLYQLTRELNIRKIENRQDTNTAINYIL
jgi:hypothetical protein